MPLTDRRPPYDGPYDAVLQSAVQSSYTSHTFDMGALMYVDVRWIVLVLVGGGAVVLTALLPEAFAPITVGIGVIGMLYVILQLGGAGPGDGTASRSGRRPRP